MPIRFLRKQAPTAGHSTIALYAITATGGVCAVSVTVDGIAGPAKNVLLSARILWRRNALVFPGRLTSATAVLT